jgi:hypothetical protein
MSLKFSSESTSNMIVGDIASKPVVRKGTLLDALNKAEAKWNASNDAKTINNHVLPDKEANKDAIAIDNKENKVEDWELISDAELIDFLNELPFVIDFLRDFA